MGLSTRTLLHRSARADCTAGAGVRSKEDSLLRMDQRLGVSRHHRLWELLSFRHASLDRESTFMAIVAAGEKHVGALPAPIGTPPEGPYGCGTGFNRTTIRDESEGGRPPPPRFPLPRGLEPGLNHRGAHDLGSFSLVADPRGVRPSCPLSSIDRGPPIRMQELHDKERPCGRIHGRRGWPPIPFFTPQPQGVMK